MLAAQSRTLRNSIISLAIFFGLVAALLFAVPGLDAAADRITHANTRLGRGGDRARGALVRRLRGAVRAGLRQARAQSQLAAVAGGAGGQLGGVGQRPGGHRAGSVGTAHEGRVGGADSKALGADLRADQRGERRRGGVDRGADVAGGDPRLAQPAAHAGAGGGRARDDRGNAGAGVVGAARGREQARCSTAARPSR